MSKIIISITLYLIVTTMVNGQPLDRQVVVTRDFEPVIQNANKISKPPEIKDTIQIKPDFKYRVYPIPAKSTFEVKSIKAAKLVGIPVSELYHYYFTAGIGNHHMPFLNIYANNLRSDNHIIGGFLNIENIEGKIKLDNDQKINAANSNINILGYGKKFFINTNLEGNLGIDLNKIHYYGLSSDTIYDPVPKGKEIKQNYNSIFTQVKIYSTKLDPDYSYNLSLDEEYTWDRYNYFENDLTLSFLNIFKLSMFDVHIDARYRLLKNNFKEDTTTNISVFNISPYFENNKGDFRYKLGMKLTVASKGGDANAYLFPNAAIEYSPAGSILTIYFGLEGNLIIHSYKGLLNENPFIIPGTQTKFSNNKIKAFAGIKGDITNKLTYNLSGEFLNIDDQILFVKDTSGIYNNYYTYIPDNIDITSISGNLDYTFKEKLLLSLGGNKYSYLVSNEEYAWHLPEWDIDFIFKYALQKKIIMGGELKLLGTRYAKDINEQTIKLAPFAVFNLRLDYNFSKVLSAFVCIKNLNASQYELWYQYPYYKTMVLIGGAYKF